MAGVTLTVQGRSLGPEPLEQVRQLAGEHPDWSRHLSRALCERGDWRDPKGQLRDMAARALLLQLEARGLVALPPRRCVPANRMRHKQGRPVEHSPEPVAGSLGTLPPLEVRELSQLAFPIFEEVPLTNHGSERDLRMEKTRQKVSGCFRTLEGASVFARTRSYISTCRKQCQNILDALEKAVAGDPFIPSAPPLH